MMSHAELSANQRDEIKHMDQGGRCQPLITQSSQMQQWRQYIERQIGFVLPDEQERWLINAINDTAMRHQLSVKQLWEALPREPALSQALLDAVLIPESRFFRHQPSVTFITDRACEYTRSISDTVASPYRIWSVGCAAGQEVWSLAMSLYAQGVFNYRIVGSDVHQQILAQARTGCFDERQRRLIPKAYQDLIQPCAEDRRRQWQVAAQLRDRVRFVWHNIFTQSVPVTQLQHLIICQNMLIYFRQFDQRDILTRLSAQCEIGGYIVLAPGEALFWRPKNMRRIDHPKVNAWQKISA